MARHDPETPSPTCRQRRPDWQGWAHHAPHLLNAPVRSCRANGGTEGAIAAFRYLNHDEYLHAGSIRRQAPSGQRGDGRGPGAQSAACTSLYAVTCLAGAKSLRMLAGVEGLEPPTLGLEIRCSILLSYTPASNQHNPALNVASLAPACQAYPLVEQIAVVRAPSQWRSSLTAQQPERTMFGSCAGKR